MKILSIWNIPLGVSQNHPKIHQGGFTKQTQDETRPGGVSQNPSEIIAVKIAYVACLKSTLVSSAELFTRKTKKSISGSH